jgi:hypothetical protein
MQGIKYSDDCGLILYVLMIYSQIFIVNTHIEIPKLYKFIKIIIIDYNNAGLCSAAIRYV